jgi:hypothetical protein
MHRNFRVLHVVAIPFLAGYMDEIGESIDIQVDR